MKLLLIQHAAIGDVLMCTPAVRALRRSFPEAEISFLVEEKAADALRHNPHIDRLLVLNTRLPRANRMRFLLGVFTHRYDVVIDFQRNPRSAVATLVSGAGQRISFEGKHRGYAYNVRVPAPHVSMYAAAAKLTLLQPLNVPPTDDCLPEMHITAGDREVADGVWARLGFGQDDFVVALSPVSRRSYRAWPIEEYASLCDHILSRHDAKILFTWGPGEFHFVEGILERMDHKPSVDYSISSIKHLRALFEKCSLFVGNDNGPRHIAIAAGIPTVGIFGHLLSSHWTPPGYAKHVAVQPARPGIRNVDIGSVAGAVDNAIGFARREVAP